MYLAAIARLPNITDERRFRRRKVDLNQHRAAEPPRRPIFSGSVPTAISKPACRPERAQQSMR